MRTALSDFWRLAGEAGVLRVDPTGQYFLFPHAGEWRLYQRGIEAAFLLATGEGALAWAKEFGVPVPGDAGEGGGRGA